MMYYIFNFIKKNKYNIYKYIKYKNKIYKYIIYKYNIYIKKSISIITLC